MKILMITTVNGLENEGMRNIATHISKELRKTNELREVGLKDVPRAMALALWADSVLICARASRKTFSLLKAVLSINKNVAILVVQRAEAEFVERYNSSKAEAHLFCIALSDVSDLKNAVDAEIVKVGINSEKFCPVDNTAGNRLRLKYGLDLDKPLVTHVGHCSSGRGLDDFLRLDPDCFQRLVVASGMFEDVDVRSRLEESGVRVLSGFNPSIQEVYQMSDVYLFPTRSAEYVISVPLSVMEALSCGLPVVAYDSIEGIKALELTSQSAIAYVGAEGNVESCIASQLGRKREMSFLSNPSTWSQTACQAERSLRTWCQG